MPKCEDVENFPSKKDTRLADSIKEVEEYSKEIMDMLMEQVIF